MNSKPTTNPAGAEDIQEAIASALSRRKPLEILGAGTKRFYGRPAAADEALSLAGMRGIVDYQPRELICVAKAGTPLTEIEAALEAEGQALAFEPPHWGEGATLGGTLACNLAGPARFKAGAARDHLLGFQAVNGRGEIIRGGGRVVKNVTGYDLSKLMCGSFGTLAVLTEACIKVLPRGEMERTVAVPGLDETAGVELLIQASRSTHDPNGLAHLPPGAELPAGLASKAGSADSLTLIRLEGPEPSVLYRSRKLAELAGRDEVFIDGEESRGLWRALREGEPALPDAGESLWRISLPPTEAAGLVRNLRERAELRGFYDWGGGLVWAVLPGGMEPDFIHETARIAGGHARLVRAAEPPGEDYPVFPPLSPASLRLHRNLKQAFDPAAVLNPGRIYAGM